MFSYRQQAPGDHYDAIVIGSGVGGLAAAVLLAEHGQRVLVLERHYAAGGFTQTFRRPGFEWDVGVHYVGQVGDPQSPGRLLFDRLTGGQLQWSQMPEVYDRVLLGERCYEFLAGEEHFCERMKCYFPDEAAAIDRYLAAVTKCARASEWYFAERCLPPIVAGLLGCVARRPFWRYARLTTAQALGEFTRNRELSGVLAGQWGCYGLPPGQSSFGIHAMLVQHYLDGGSYPRGGSSRIAATMVAAIERAGGAVVVCAEVARILTDAGNCAAGVCMVDGREIRAKCVISDAGMANTFHRLLPPEVSGVEALRRELDTVPPSIGHLCLYAGLEGAARELGLTGTNLWIYPSEDHDANTRLFLSDPAAPLPYAFISFPSAKDPEFERRHPGRSTVEVVTLASYSWFQRWEHTQWMKRGRDYEAFKAAWLSRLLEVLYRRVPAARGRVLHAELSTPLSTRHCANQPRGEMYGLAHTPQRFRLRGLGPRTPVRNLYIAGQDVCTCGITGAAIGGVLAASAVLRRNLL